MTINFIIWSDSFHDRFNPLSCTAAPLYLLFPPYFSLLIAPCISLSLVVQLSGSAAYRIGQAVRLQWRLWWGGLLGAPEQRCSASRGEEEQQEATFFHLSHHVTQAYASSSPSAALHGDQRASADQLQQPDSSCTDWRDHWGAFLQCTFTGKRGEATLQILSELLYSARSNTNKLFVRAIMMNFFNHTFYCMFKFLLFCISQQF